MRNEKGSFLHTICISELETPSNIQNACNGAVRKIVNKLPPGQREKSCATVGAKLLGDKRSAAGSPFSAPCIACNDSNQQKFLTCHVMLNYTRQSPDFYKK